MKLVKYALLLILLLGSIAAGSAWADRGHFRGHHRSYSHFGLVIGVPLAWPGYYRPYYSPYYPPYYYDPPVVAVPSSPPVYIERADAGAAPAQSNYWYYCDNPQGYYPYVKECPAGWQKVVPQPPPR
jgi:hypothetical protein